MFEAGCWKVSLNLRANPCQWQEYCSEVELCSDLPGGKEFSYMDAGVSHHKSNTISDGVAV